MFKKILVPTDGSSQAAHAAHTATELAKSQGAQIVGVYVIDPFPYIGSATRRPPACSPT